MSGMAMGDDVLKIATAIGEVATKDVFKEVLRRKRVGFQNEIVLGWGKTLKNLNGKKLAN